MPAVSQGRRDGAVLVTGAADHRSLFPRAAAVVHHGGSGTSHAAARAGVPQVVVPHVGDQRYWAARLHALGVAPEPIPARDLTAETLGARLRAATSESTVGAATRLAATLAAEDGVGTAVRLINERLALR